MDASGSGDNGKYCGKTLRKPDNADGKDDTDDTDDTEQCGRCERCERCERCGRCGRYELVRTGANWCESATRWTGRRGGESGERIERKKQACENAGPTTRPESRTNS